MTDYRKAFEYCPMCKETDSSDWWVFLKADCRHCRSYFRGHPETLTWVKCLKCGHEFCDSYLTEEAFKVLDEKERNVPPPSIAALETERLLANHWFERLQLFGHGPRQTEISGQIRERTILDIGFGGGGNLMVATELGYRARGIDVREVAVERALALDLCVRQASLDDERLVLNHQSDIVFLCDVLEHLADPRDALRKAAEFVRPDGALCLSFPNASSPIWRRATGPSGVGNDYYAEIEHAHNFTARQVRELLGEIGFRVRQQSISRRYRFGLEVLARRRYVSGVSYPPADAGKEGREELC